MLQKYAKDLKREFAGYNAKGLLSDVMAGLTVAAVALPLALAFGVSSGASAASGLLTAIVAGAIIALLGGAFYQISGPTGAMAAILTSVVAQYGLNGVFQATFLAGVLLVIAGLFKLGRLTAFIPMPVITGFTSGIAVIIALGQVDNFFGVTSIEGSAIQKVGGYFTHGFDPNWTAVAIGLFVVLFMVFFPKKWNSVVPASLVAIILTTAASMVLKLPVNTVGEIPSSLMLPQRLDLFSLDLNTLSGLLAPAISIAALGMVESLLCGASASRMTGVKLDNDRELLAQGIGNILTPLFGGIPATAAIARTSVAVKSGARTRLTGVFHALFLLISMLVLGPVMGQIPLCALAGVLMVTAWRMNEWKTIRYIFSKKFKGAILKFLVTMAATILFDLTVAILLGIVVSLVLLAVRQSELQVNYEDVLPHRLAAPDALLAHRAENARVVYITGSILFSNTQMIEEIGQQVNGFSSVIFSMRGVSYMDISGAQAFLDLLRQVQNRQAQVFLCGVSPSVRQMMDRSGITQQAGEKAFYWSVEQALTQDEPTPAPYLQTAAKN